MYNVEEITKACAFAKDSALAQKRNREIFEELDEKYSTKRVYEEPTEEELNNYDIVYKREKGAFGDVEFSVYKYPQELEKIELALILDKGDLIFGFSAVEKSWCVEVTIYND